MIDGITLKYDLPEFKQWQRTTGLSFTVKLDTQTGEMKTKIINQKMITTYKARWETFDITVKQVECQKTRIEVFYLTMKGSLHKNYYGGHNYLPFTWQKLQDQIKYICNSLQLDPIQVLISGLEIGVNIKTTFPVSYFLRHNIISYKGHPFNFYDPDSSGFRLGIVCKLAQYSVKIYDKGVQCNLAEPLMRFELRYSKMQPLKPYGISNLSDLTDCKKIHGLQKLLINAWNDVLLFDVIDSVRDLVARQAKTELLTEGQNFKFWEKLKDNCSGSHYKYQRTKFKNLVLKFGNNSHAIVKDLIQTEWENLFKEEITLPILTIKIKGNYGHNIISNIGSFG